MIIWVLWAAWLCVIFCFSAQPADKSDSQTLLVIDLLNSLFGLDLYSGEIIEQFGFLQSIDFVVRKSAHFTEYLILGALSYLVFSDFAKRFEHKKSIRAGIAAGFCLIYAISDEVHQIFVAGRTGKSQDVLIDFSGSVVGILICAGISALVMAIKRKRKKADLE